ncbi:glycosyltransferase family 4 protein [Candidatus Falkowbacteria bacterium]|nr:glycosyltransferase family 4 protein [Candidatus Falkowbacteria bacterium]
MKIGIDCRNFYDAYRNEGAGIERYAYHLTKSLIARDKVNDYVLFFYSDLSPEAIHRVRTGNPRVKIVKVLRRNSRLPFWDSHIKFSALLKKEKLDLTIFPANTIPLFYRQRSILVIHDLAIFLHPEWFPDRQWFSRRIVVPRSIRTATKIVAVSESTKLDLCRLFKTAEKKTRVIYPGVAVKEDYSASESEKVKIKFGIGADYVLFIGTMEPRKNAVNLLKAFFNYIFENEASHVSLVLAGIKGWKFQNFFGELSRVNQQLVGQRVKYIGKISNRERNILIKNCRAFVFPSLYEGFGFPVAEALALGAPVVTSDNSSLKEIGEGCAILINPEDANDIRRGIKKALEDKVLRFQLISRGQERARQFSWIRTAEKFVELFSD